MNKGFTFIDVSIALLILSILLSIAIPALSSFLTNSRLVSVTNELVVSLNLARSEAVKQKHQVTIRRTSSTEKTWEKGWSIFSDHNNDGILNGPDQLIRTIDPLSDGYTIRTGNNFKDWVAYLPNGLSRSGRGLGNGTFRICPPDHNLKKARRVVVNSVGRIRSAKTASSCP